MSKVFIICGHGAGDSGAVGGGYTEANLVRQLASRMKALGGADVEVGDTSVDWYDSNYIGRGKCPKGVPVIELHMDSSSASAKGGHVIIKAGLAADQYDSAIASFIKSFFPGRAQSIVGRSDLANPNRAQSMGVNYRLVECGFISNDGDRSKFINQMDDLARGLLSAFGVQTGQTQPTEPEKPANELPEALRGYSDIDPDAWYVDGLADAVEAGIINGHGSTMDPDGALTRGQAVCLIANAERVEFEHPFSDVVASPYYYDAVAWAKEEGIVSGSGGEFWPDDPCTRAQLAAMLHNLAGNPEPAGEPTGYSDWGDVPEWAREAMAWCVESGVISGSGGKLRPEDAATRAEGAIIILRYERG